MAVEIVHGFLRLNLKSSREGMPGHVFLKGSAIVKVVPYESETTLVICTSEHGADTFVTEAPSDIFEAITRTYKEVTRR